MNQIHNHIKGNFTIIPNGLIEDVKISDRSRFLYVVLSQKPPNWIFYTKQLCKSLGMHPDTFRKYRNELCKRGWLFVEEQKKQDGSFKSRIYHLYPDRILIDNKDLNEIDNEEKERILPTPENTVTDNISDGKNHSTNNKNSKQEEQLNKKNKRSLDNSKNSTSQNPNPRQ